MSAAFVLVAALGGFGLTRLTKAKAEIDPSKLATVTRGADEC